MTSAEAAYLPAAFRLLSLAFTPPDDTILEQLRRLTVFTARHAPDESLAELLAEVEHLLDDDDLLEQLVPEYEALFGGAVRCPPYEGSYEADPFRHARQMADLNGFYRAFGASPSGPATERPDHVGCELEFLSFLVLRRLEADEAGDGEAASVCEQAEDSFLREHLGRWVPTFCRDVAQATESPIYRLLALVGERVVVRELAARELEPAPLPRRARTAVEGDSVTCGHDPEPRTGSRRSGSKLR